MDQNNELIKGWNLLSQKNDNSEGIQSIPIEIFEQFRVSLGLFHPIKEQALIFEFDEPNILLPWTDLELEGLSFHKSKSLESNKYKQVFVLKKSQEQDITVFNKICLDLLSYARNYSSISTLKYFTVLKSRLNIWIHFLKSSEGKYLGIRKQAGLLGELIFLEKIKPFCPNENVWINCWKGPEKHCHDFITAKGAFEIKALLKGEPVVSISNIEQLDDTQVGKLFLTVFELSECDEINLTLNKAVDDIIISINSEETLEKFLTKLELSGYTITDHANYSTSFSLTRIHCFEVSGNFPKLVRSNVNTEIVNLKYTLDISNLIDFRVALDHKLKDSFNGIR